MTITAIVTATILPVSNPGYTGENMLNENIRFEIDRASYIGQYDPIFKKPILQGRNAIPVGNGDLAVVAWQPGHLTWMLNKNDIGGVASQAARLSITTPDAVPVAERVGRLETRLSLYDATGTVEYRGGELPQEAGWIWRGKPGAAPQVTDRDLGTVRASFYVPNGRNVFLLSYEEESKLPHPVTIALERWIQKEYGGTIELAATPNTISLFYNLEKSDYSDSYAVALAFDGFQGAVVNKAGDFRGELNIPAGTTFSGRVAVAVVTSNESDDPLAAATALAADALTQNAEVVKSQNDAWWRDFWSRFHLNTGQPYANALYYMSIYELGVTSRGRMPVKFNGALNLWNEKARKWGASYWCHNQSESYLQVYAANQIELAENFHDWIVRVRPEAVKAARKYFQVDGAYYREVMDHFYQVKEPETPTQPQGMDYILSSGTRYALMLWNRYRYTLDKEFLEEKAYPVIRDCAEFYASYGKLGDDGLYHVGPALSWEEPPLGRDAHADCAAWRAIFATAIAAGEILGIDQDDISRWRNFLEKAPPYPVDEGVFSVVMREDGTPEPTDHYQWQMPNLSGVFPYGVIGMDSPPELRSLAEETFKRYRFNADAGHEFLPVIAARLGHPEWWRTALFQYIQYFQVHDQGLFHYYNILGSKEYGDSDSHDSHYPYLESSGIFATAVNEAMLQSHNGKIRVFPAIPERWPARFILRAAGSFLVASEHRGMEGVPYITIQPMGGGARDCVVVSPWDEGAQLIVDGKQMDLQEENGLLTFAVKPGEVYTLLPQGGSFTDIPLVSDSFSFQISPARLGNAWIGSRDGPNNHSNTFPLW